MAYENINRDGVRTCRYDGTEFTSADNNMGIVVRVTAGVGLTSDYGWGRPYVEKLGAGTGGTTPGTAGDIYGVAQTVETPSGQARAPSGERLVSVATRGILKTKKVSAPVLADIGKKIAVETATANLDPGGVDTVNADATPGRGVVVGITGTGADDFLLVDWR